MFSPDMSRTLIPLLFSFALMGGCAVQPPEQTAGIPTPDGIRFDTVEEWLDLQQEVTALGNTEVASRLATIDKSADSGQLYYFGVLNQQLKTYGAWTVARDTFQKLQDNQSLSREQRQLAGIFRQYNQNRINSFSRQRELLNDNAKLQQQLTAAESEKQQLAQKIQALTEVETAISTRREE
jgi:hypothetical protein